MAVATRDQSRARWLAWLADDTSGWASDFRVPAEKEGDMAAPECSVLCASGEQLTSEAKTAATKDLVVSTLGGAAEALRGNEAARDGGRPMGYW